MQTLTLKEVVNSVHEALKAGLLGVHFAEKHDTTSCRYEYSDPKFHCAIGCAMTTETIAQITREGQHSIGLESNSWQAKEHGYIQVVYVVPEERDALVVLQEMHDLACKCDRALDQPVARFTKWFLAAYPEPLK